MVPREVRSCFVAVGLLFLFMAGCGGGGGGNGASGPSPPPTPDFTVSLSPTSVTLAQGGASQVQVSVAAQNGFTGSVSVTVAGLPDGVTVSPASLSLPSGSSGTLTLSASSTAQVAQESINVDAVSGTIKVDASLQLTVAGAVVPDPFHAIGGTLVHGFYDESRQLLFATNPGLNELDVISGQDFSVKARVAVPQPWGIDQMADGKTLVIGTAAQEIITLDEDTLSIMQHPYSAVGNSVFTLFFPNAVAMANGKVLIVGQEQGIGSNDILDGGQYLYEWDSNTNTFAQLEPTSQNQTWETDSLARSADHKWAAFAADQFYLYSSDSDSLASVPLTTVNPPQDEFGVRGYAINADGTKIGVASATSVTFLNRSFAVLGSSSIPGAFQTARTAVQFSADGSRLFLQYDLPIAIEEIDANSYTALGYLTAVATPENNEERLLATDSAGRAFVGVAGGVRLVDLTKTPVPNTPNGNMSGPNCTIPATILSSNASSNVQLLNPLANESVYVGGQPAPLLSGGTAISIPVSSTTGSVDVECVGTNGDTLVIVDGVSYGVDPIGFSANLLPPSGNPIAYLFGFGFYAGPELFYTTHPSFTGSLSVGGQAAMNATTLGSVWYGTTLEGLAFQVPDGTPGESADVAVSSSIGSGSLSTGATYYPAPSILPASGLLQLIYDSHRSLLYALKTTEVDVLNPTTLQWQSPLALPQPASAVSYEVMALSPDGSRLVVASADGHIVVLNPDQPAQASLLQGPFGSGSLAVTKFNKAILPAIGAVELDLSTLTFTPLNINTGHVIKSSADGTHLYGADLNISSGAVYSIDPSTYAVQTEQFGEMFWNDLAVSTDGSQFAAVYAPPFVNGDAVGFFDSSLRYLNANVYPDFSPPDDTGVLGATFSPGGESVGGCSR
jgi:hypothetical protein